jgi:glycosyltransferase involved in cell wall biosynthesis
MASKKPIVATNVGGVADLLGNTVNGCKRFNITERGILVNRLESETVAKALQAIIDNTEIRKKLGDKGREFVSESYRTGRLIKDIDYLYSFLLKK